MSWWKRTGPPSSGLVVFAGTVPAAAFDRLADAGITVETRRESEGVIHLRLRHPAWGRADLRFPVQPPHPQLLEWDPRLTPQEKSTARHAGWAARVDLESPVGDVLRDRKQLLRYLRAVSGEDAVVAMDLTSETFWPPAALEDELSHDAELDIEALFSLHLIHEPPTGTPYWLHSHGLREMGFTDFDVLDPHPEVVSRGSDLLRAIAFAIVEGRLAAGGATVEVADGLKLRLVPVRQALGRMDPGAFLLWRRDVDETHTEGHGLLCDPASGLFGRRREQPRPAAFFKAPLTREPLILFSTEASALMARRARDTYSMLRTMAAELAGYDLPVLVKLAYAMDRSPEDREHLWFQVHALEDEHVDATLVNEPAGISRLRVGDRGTHPVDLLSDWAVMTPFGMINPRWTVAWRRIRQDPEDFREAVRRAQPSG